MRLIVMSGLDPYDVLGVDHSAQMATIKQAYRNMLVQTHPDKYGGDAKYFMLIHDAYAAIQKHRKDLQRCQPMPKKRQVYTADNMPAPTKMQDFTASKFNSYFDKNRIDTMNPYANGYQDRIVSSTKHREDIDHAAKSTVYIPQTKVVLYKEPECLSSSSYVQNCYELGRDTVSDFTGGGGTDIMKAFVHTTGERIDTVQRYNNVDHILSERSSQNLQMTEDEKHKIKKNNKKLAKLEALRLQNMQLNDERIDSRYVNLHNRLH